MHGRIGRQKMLAEIYKECGSIFGKGNTPMTDKQIIFKCDVDCIRKNTEECFELDCIKGQESILKQLQAKEQECEKLKKILDQLKAENEGLRQLLSKEPLALQALQSGYSDYKKRSEVFFEMVQEYKQTLTEIKEIVGIGLVDGLQPEEYSGFLKILQAQILQKISECEGNDEDS